MAARALRALQARVVADSQVRSRPQALFVLAADSVSLTSLWGEEVLDRARATSSVLEMYTDLEAIIRLAEYTPQPTVTLSNGDRELIQLQLLIWAPSFNSRLSIWHASQILRHFTDTDVVEAFAASTSCCHQ